MRKEFRSIRTVGDARSECAYPETIREACYAQKYEDAQRTQEVGIRILSNFLRWTP